VRLPDRIDDSGSSPATKAPAADTATRRDTPTEAIAATSAVAASCSTVGSWSLATCPRHDTTASASFTPAAGLVATVLPALAETE
jgi:hypothetical protein